MKKVIIGICLSLILLLSFCQNESRWYPEADVTINSHYEMVNDTLNTKQLIITCVIHNISKTSIYGGAVTLEAETDKRKYLQTITINTKILPDGKIAVNTAISYYDNTESLIEDGISVYSCYFE